MTDLYYQSWEWVEIQKEMHEDENAKSIMDEFSKEKEEFLIITETDILAGVDENNSK